MPSCSRHCSAIYHMELVLRSQPMWFESTSHVFLSILTFAVVPCLTAELFSHLTRQRWPAIEHALWMVVLLRLVIPPFCHWGFLVFPLRKQHYLNHLPKFFSFGLPSPCPPVWQGSARHRSPAKQPFLYFYRGTFLFAVEHF